MDNVVCVSSDCDVIVDNLPVLKVEKIKQLNKHLGPKCHVILHLGPKLGGHSC